MSDSLNFTRVLFVWVTHLYQSNTILLLLLKYDFTTALFLILKSEVATIRDSYSWHWCRNMCEGQLIDGGLDIPLHSTLSQYRQQPAGILTLSQL